MEEIPAAVLVVLRYLMQEAVVSVPGSQVVMTGAGERGGVLDRGVLIWLYHAAPALVFGTAGAGASLSSVSVDLHLLLTCVGDERRYEPARILGACVGVLEGHPILRRSDAEEALAAISGHGLSTSAVRGAWVDLPLTLHAVSVNEVVQLWGASGGARGVSIACRVGGVPCGSSHGGRNA